MILMPCASTGTILLSNMSGPPLGAHHERHVGPIHVEVDEADLGAPLLQRQREVHGDGGLADPALARRHRDGVLDLGDEVGGRRRRPVSRGRLRRRGGAHLHLHLPHAGNLRDDLGGAAVQRRLRRGRLTREGQGERHVGVVDVQVFDEPDRHDVLPAIGIMDAAEGVQHGSFGDGGARGRAHRVLPSIALGVNCVASPWRA